MQNLNEIEFPSENCKEPQNDYSISAQDGKMCVYFKDLEKHLISHIEKAGIIIGCVAWLTNENIIMALAQKDVSLIVQKEDFLRPDIGECNNYYARLHRNYSFLKCDIDKYYMPGRLGEMSYCGDPSVDPIRCVGNHNSEKNPAFPRMHNKFLVFCERESGETEEGDYKPPKAYGVWTGSFNLTKCATHSFENAVYIENEEIAEAYAREHSQIFVFSEPLDWKTQWMEPEFRFGS
jgi:hypothetical protein